MNGDENKKAKETLQALRFSIAMLKNSYNYTESNQVLFKRKKEIELYVEGINLSYFI